MSKVIKAFSLDRRTVEILEDYCRHSDNWKKKISRSKVVNDAIVWFLSDTDRAQLVASQEALMEKVRELAQARDFPVKKKSWWRQLLGF